jgi:hypothetical protein
MSGQDNLAESGAQKNAARLFDLYSALRRMFYLHLEYASPSLVGLG